MSEQTPEGRVVTAQATARPVGTQPLFTPPSPDDTSEMAFFGRMAAKVARCYLAIGKIAKNGINKDQGYEFVSVEDIFDACRKAMAESGLALIQHGMGEPLIAPTGNNGRGRHMMLPVTYFLIDCETGYHQVIEWRGECIEYSDKAITKCLTSANKSLLRSLFLIPAGEDDPDAYTPEPAAPAPAQGQPAPRGSRNTAPAQQPAQEPAQAPQQGITEAALEKIKKDEGYAEFRQACQEKGLDIADTARAAWNAGARTKPELIQFASEQRSDAPAEMATIERIVEAIKSMELDPTDPVHLKVASRLLETEVTALSLLSEGQADEVATYLEAVAAGAEERPAEYEPEKKSGKKSGKS